MEWNIGVEMRNEYRRMELARAAMKLVRDVMLCKPGENLVITYDTCVDERVVHALTEAAYTIEAVPTVIYYPTAEGFYADPPQPVADAIAAADVWIELAYASIMHGPAYRRAVDPEMLVNCIGKINVDKVIELGEYFKHRLESAEDIQVLTKDGMNLRGKMGGRKVRHSGIKATEKGYPVMLTGQTSWCPIEESIEGTLVFTGAVFPPDSLGILRDKICIEFKEGRVVDVTGGSEAQIYKNWLYSFDDPNMLRLAHYSQGFNPGVTKVTGRIVEDERVFGCMEFGIGSQGVKIGGAHWSAASHSDGIVLRPTIILDGEKLEEDGVYVDPTARKICAELGIAGY